jgi:DNA-binding transcriptional LysR family regulator
MELRHLRYFCAVAAEGHVHRAADRLSIAQPALTQQIKALEMEIGARLLARVGRGIALTETGKMFYAEAQAILQHVDMATSLARQVDAGEVGRLRIGFTESASFHSIVTGALKSFRSSWPSVECELQEQHTENLIQSLQDRRLDVAFVRPPVRLEDAIAFEALTEESLVVAMPSDHQLSGSSSLTIEDLKDESFVVYPRQHGLGLSDAVMAECRRSGFAPKIAQQTPQLSSTINLVAAGLGIAVVPECMRNQRPESVRFIRLHPTGLCAKLGIAYRKDNLSQSVRHLVEMALAERTRKSPSLSLTVPAKGKRKLVLR